MTCYRYICDILLCADILSLEFAKYQIWMLDGRAAPALMCSRIYERSLIIIRWILGHPTTDLDKFTSKQYLGSRCREMEYVQWWQGGIIMMRRVGTGTQPTAQCFRAIWINSNSSLHSQYTENHQANILSGIGKRKYLIFQFVKIFVISCWSSERKQLGCSVAYLGARTTSLGFLQAGKEDWTPARQWP